MLNRSAVLSPAVRVNAEWGEKHGHIGALFKGACPQNEQCCGNEKRVGSRLSFAGRPRIDDNGDVFDLCKQLGYG